MPHPTRPHLVSQRASLHPAWCHPASPRFTSRRCNLPQPAPPHFTCSRHTVPPHFTRSRPALPRPSSALFALRHPASPDLTSLRRTLPNFASPRFTAPGLASPRVASPHLIDRGSTFRSTPGATTDRSQTDPRSNPDRPRASPQRAQLVAVAAPKPPLPRRQVPRPRCPRAHLTHSCGDPMGVRATRLSRDHRVCERAFRQQYGRSEERQTCPSLPRHGCRCPPRARYLRTISSSVQPVGDRICSALLAPTNWRSRPVGRSSGIESCSERSGRHRSGRQT